MPYRSDAQRKFFHANEKKLKKQGVNIKEWDDASKGMSLPEHVSDKPKKRLRYVTRPRPS
jgi:hypothetical protein